MKKLLLLVGVAASFSQAAWAETKTRCKIYDPRGNPVDYVAKQFEREFDTLTALLEKDGYKVVSTTLDTILASDSRNYSYLCATGTK